MVAHFSITLVLIKYSETQIKCLINLNVLRLRFLNSWDLTL